MEFMEEFVNGGFLSWICQQELREHKGGIRCQTHLWDRGCPAWKIFLDVIWSACHGTKMHKHSGLWHVDVAEAAQELFALVTPERLCLQMAGKWLAVPFQVSNASVVFPELIHKIPYKLLPSFCLIRTQPPWCPHKGPY